jgi:hypothetical protein
MTQKKEKKKLLCNGSVPAAASKQNVNNDFRISSFARSFRITGNFTPFSGYPYCKVIFFRYNDSFNVLRR